MTLPSGELLVEEWRKRLKEYALTVQEKLEKGIEIKPQDAAYLNMYCVDQMTNHIATSLDQMTKNITATLKKTENELSRRMDKHIEEHEKKRQTLGEQIYDLHGSELEKEHMDKIVAIDIESGVIAGMGNSVTEAYNQAKEKFGERQYYFKRIGRKYLYRFR